MSAIKLDDDGFAALERQQHVIDNPPDAACDQENDEMPIQYIDQMDPEAVDDSDHTIDNDLTPAPNGASSVLGLLRQPD